jgi:hypothetical protein
MWKCLGGSCKGGYGLAKQESARGEEINLMGGFGVEIVRSSIGVTRGYKDGLQPETLADGNKLVKQNQPVSKIETKSDTNLRSLYES